MMSRWRTVERLRAFARAALTVLAALLPFEKLEPLARIGPLQLSSVELFLYLALAAWGLAVVARWWAGERDLVERMARAPFAHHAVAAFGLVLLVSAALAPAARGTALKFALRSLGGMLLYAAAADLLRAPGASVRAAKALVGGAVVAALLAVTEARSVAVGALLHSFHLSTFEALGRPRASGPFQYPNIAAMYLEAVAPIAAALGAAAFVARQSRLQLWGAMLVLLLLLDGVLATASRAGLVGGLAAVAALAALYGRRGETRALAPALLATMLALAALASGSELVSLLEGRRLVSGGRHPFGRKGRAAAPGARGWKHGDREPGRSEPGRARLGACPSLPGGAVLSLAGRQHGRGGGPRRAAHRLAARSVPGRQRAASGAGSRPLPSGPLRSVVGPGAGAHDLVQ